MCNELATVPPTPGSYEDINRSRPTHQSQTEKADEKVEGKNGRGRSRSPKTLARDEEEAKEKAVAEETLLINNGRTV